MDYKQSSPYKNNQPYIDAKYWTNNIF